MSNVIVLNENLEKAGDIQLSDSYNEIKEHNLYLFNKSYLASLRANTAVSKTRAEVKGGGKKPWSQKGRGGARAGSITSPIFVGGGKAHGATFRNYTQKVNTKQKKLALSYALNEQAKADNVFVIDKVEVSSGKTKDATSYLAKLNKKDTLIVVEEFDEKTYLSFRNIKNVYMINRKELNAYLVSVYSSILIEKSVFENIVKEG